ncbi:MAG TPA: hypothetical protein VKZ18_25205 [Polyangia bacterium]|nr:hypothetical protein [Polyangia bacterium]
MSQSTASRWLASARQLLLEDVKTTFRERFGMPSSEVGSLVDLIASRLDLSLSGLLQSR